MQVKQETEVGQILWILLNKQKNEIKVAVIYAQHEVVKPNKKF